jgi:membrane-associated phospholipid phosphatase
VLLAVLVVAFVTLYWLAVRTSAGQLYDAGFFGRVGALRALSGPAPALMRETSPYVLAGAVCVPAVLAVASRRWRRLAGASLVIVVATAGAHVLKDWLLIRPDLGDHGYAQNSFPSAHVAVVAALCVAVVLLWPDQPTWPVVTGAAGVAVLAAAANVVSYAHRPSDVVGSLLLVAAVTVAVAWGLRLTGTPPEAVSLSNGPRAQAVPR